MKVILILVALGAAGRAFTYLERQWRRSNNTAAPAASSDITVVDEGTEPRVKLDAWFKTGATSRSTATFVTTTTTSGGDEQPRIVPLVAVITNRVVEATPADARVEWRLESLAIARAEVPAEADLSDLQRWVDAIPRTPVVRGFHPGGRVSVDADAGLAAGANDVTMLRILGDALVLAAPEIPVGPGARWRVNLSPAFAEYELVARANGRTTIRVRTSMSMPTPQGHVTSTTNAEMEYADGDPLPASGKATFRFALADAAAAPTVEMALSITSP